MTPKEKANELVDRFTFTCRECDFEENAKQCALIAVDETIELLCKNRMGDLYYRQVKQEIELL